jgi:pimeloyl-ACP methyl ester carboxylesterase
MPSPAGLYYFSHLEEERSQLPVLLLHGAGGTYMNWPTEIRRLEGFRTFALDLPGHGKSEGIGRHSVAEYAQDVRSFMDACGLAKAAVVGHSMGGAIALTFALENPHRLLALGLVATGGRLKVAPALLESTANTPSSAPAAKQIGALLFGGQVSARVSEQVVAGLAATRPTVLHGDFLACESFDKLRDLEQLEVPTLIMCGREDRMTPVHYSEHLAASIRGSRLALIEGAGHMVMLEQPAAAAAALADFLRQIPYRPGG